MTKINANANRDKPNELLRAERVVSNKQINSLFQTFFFSKHFLIMLFLNLRESFNHPLTFWGINSGRYMLVTLLISFPLKIIPNKIAFRISNLEYKLTKRLTTRGLFMYVNGYGFWVSWNSIHYCKQNYACTKWMIFVKVTQHLFLHTQNFPLIEQIWAKGVLVTVL